MKAVIQRVLRASVEVRGEMVGKIGQGLVVLLGVSKGDGDLDCRTMANKLRTLRIFADEQGKMNRSLIDVGGSILLISQFTLLADCRSGRRPSFDHAALPSDARAMYDRVAASLRREGTVVEMGSFGAHMEVDLVNDGPVTFVLDTRPIEGA